MMLNPSVNHVYRSQAAELAAAELAVTADFASDIAPEALGAGVGLRFSAEEIDELVLAQQSSHMVTFERAGELLRPLDIRSANVMDDDLLTIPKYQGKTNEAFTRMLLHLTLSWVDRPGPLDVLDPMTGRGTTLLAAWTAGHNGYGVEVNGKAFDAMTSYLKTYLRTKRLKHSAEVTPVRREGRSVGRRFDAEVRLAEATSRTPARPGMPTLAMTVFTGDTRDSAALFGKKRFDAIVTDAPYGVVHGAATDRSQRGARRCAAPSRERRPGDLLAEAIPVWRRQLKPGGALGIAWNTLTLPRAELVSMITDAGLTVVEGEQWQFAHRVDSSIRRDLLVAISKVN
ncbi:hypothetical protein HMPREF1531_01318 [Propionibacterium sp. oral taxon 192 str. F0372]|nr:hypothetical protein HMPREF1531_01318 [Propionibacterium sp. oral taxon 192 str. F0372]